MRGTLKLAGIACSFATSIIPGIAVARPAALFGADAELAAAREASRRATPSPRLIERVPASLALAERFRGAGEPAKAGAALNVAVVYYLLAGELQSALTVADRAAELCEAAGDRRCYGNAMNQSGIALLRLNDPYAAMQRLDRSARAFRDAHDIERAAIAQLNAANIRFDIGDLNGALADYDAIDRQYGADRRWDPTGMLNSKATVLLRLGRIAEARRTVTRAADALRQRGRSRETRWASDVVNATRGTMALVEASAGNAAAALPLYRAYLMSSKASGSPLELYYANFAFAEGLMTLGRPRDAYPYIQTALSLAAQTDPVGRRDAYDLASRITAAVGRPDEALRHLRAAETIRTELAAATMRSAVADAHAQTAVAEREAQLARRDARWASQRTRLLGWSAFGVIGLILAAVAALIRLRSQATEQRYAAVLGERTRMARELHDTLLQGFTGITLQLRAAARSDPGAVRAKLGAMADEAGRWVSETRHAVWDMRAATFDDDVRAGLEQAIATARGQGDAAIEACYAIEAQPDPARTRALLRVAQEALSNAARHARASHIDLSMAITSARAELLVADDGVGFKMSPDQSALGGHWGLLGMRERIEALGGEFTVGAAPGQGTRVRAVLPL